MSTSEKSLFRLSALTVACALACTTLTAQAQEAETVHELDKVTVDEQVETAGKTVLKAAELEMQPNGTGTVTDALRGQSFVQFDMNSRSNSRAGEITPPQISIRGGRNYENNFTINGLSNNNHLNPTGWSHTHAMRGDALPESDAQAAMISTDMLDNIKVLTENVSAEYGDFTGGVIDARIRDARTDRWHAKLWTRHTRDAWAKQHLTDDQKTLNGMVESDVQSEFKRTNAGIMIDGPLADGKLGVLFSYEKAHSNTPSYEHYTNSDLTKYYVKKHGERDMDTFMAHVNTDKNNDFYVASTLIYSPYEAQGHVFKAKDSPWQHEGGGWNFSLNTRANLSTGTWTNDFGYSTTEATRNSPTNVSRLWLYDPNSSYANWFTQVGRKSKHEAWEGSDGDFERKQAQYSYKSIFALNPLKTGDITHRIRTGLEAIHTEVKSKAEGNVKFLRPEFNNKVQGSMDDGILAGEQFAAMRSTSEAWDRSFNMLQLSAFVEDEAQIGRFTVRPGVRLSYDDYTDDVNVAPRFFANMDVLNDGRFNVSVGANRYYGSMVLLDAINRSLDANHNRAEWRRWIEEENRLGGWGETAQDQADGQASARHPTLLGDITTPYADEFTFGASANIYDTLFKLTAVKRDHKDQIRKEVYGTRNTPDGKISSVLTNKGETEYKGITLSMEKAFDLNQWGRHNMELGITWSRSKSNTFSWADAWEDDPEVSRGMFIDGVRYDSADELNNLDSPNANAEWVITLAHDASFMDDRLRTNALLRWESGSERFARGESVEIPNPARPTRPFNYSVYNRIEQDHMFNADLSLAYDLVKTANTTVTVNVEALNLFNNKSLVNTTTGMVGQYDHFNMGRQFFLGLTCQY